MWLWSVAGIGAVAGLAALWSVRRARRRLAELSQAYWELRYDYTRLRSQVAQFDPDKRGRPETADAAAPASFVPLSSLTSASILIFVVVGLFQPGLTRLLTYKGIDALGVAITDPIRATTPLFSAMMAILFLGEKITLPIVVATLTIMAGITLLSWRSGSMKLVGSAVFLWYPIAASALAGASQVVRKFGLAAVPHPFLAAAVTASSSFVVSLLTLWYVEKTQETWKMNRQCFGWFLAAGVTISLGMACIYYALDLGKVSVVIPISSTGPFFSLVFAALFLRDVERVTLRIVIAAAMIIGGVLLLTLWK
jgi:drug/metabolite transporter (DMT)-like permease